MLKGILLLSNYYQLFVLLQSVLCMLRCIWQSILCSSFAAFDDNVFQCKKQLDEMLVERW